MGIEEGRATKKGSTKKWTEDARGIVSGIAGGGRETRRICRTRATRSECCPARKNGYSFSNVPDAHARFPAKRMAEVRVGRGRGRRQQGKRSELTGRDEEGDGDDQTGEVEKDVVDVEVDQEEEEEEVKVTLRLATGKKSMSSPPALALSPLSRSTQPSATSIGQNKRTRIHDP